jgi:methylmalonyl-CoA mutase
MVRNTYIYPPEPSMRIVSDIIAYTSAHMPKFNSISISGYHMQEAGATQVQELAFTIADGKEYAKAAMATGLDIDKFAGRLSFFFAIGMNFFMEVAKLRAARKLWHGVMTELGAKDERSKMLRTHCQTSGVSLTEQDPYNNVIRTTVEAMAAALGGTQSLHTNALDEAIALPTDFSARIARNTQIVLQEETGITKVVDPLGGSYYVEALTQELHDRALEIIARVDAEGGMAKAVAAGWPKAMIEEASAARAARVDKGEDVIVGVNRFRVADEQPIEFRAIDNATVRDAQIRRIEKAKAGRDEARCRAALDALREGARRSDNLLALAVECARARATLGEISSAMEDVFGRYDTVPTPVSGIYGGAQGDSPGWLQAGQGVEAVGRRLGRKAAHAGRQDGPGLATTAAPTSSPPHSPTSVSRSFPARSSRHRRKAPASPSSATSTWSARPVLRPATSPWCPNWSAICAISAGPTSRWWWAASSPLRIMRRSARRACRQSSAPAPTSSKRRRRC